MIDEYCHDLQTHTSNNFFNFQMSSLTGLREARQMVRPTLRRRRRRRRQEVQCTSNFIVNVLRINFTTESPLIVKVEVTI